ncbi:ATP-binding protein [Caballeronia sp. SEWSISQ10-4 2]|uniref:ATP-binding protein n=1 Tax=Caballeronia sp. SEWSISQ10-4 2 TaxID=2937438 RepID=UPI002652EE8C|nr:ATP-binding protein [Caballeronia sp. SEWSISQ10-4 2]MDN7179623.1 ATP-binding protein [Caballeronia sp. SEWSISQ10-4 2]
MNAPANWHEANADYLSAALDCLRLRLERLAGLAGNAGSGEPSVDAAPFWQEEQARADACASGVEPPPALPMLARCFGLSRFEEEVLLLCAAMELDTRIADLCAWAQHPAARAYPTFALALALFDDPAWDVLSPQRPLRYWRLIEIGGDRSQPLTVRPLYIDERIVSYIKGLNHVDERLDALLLGSMRGAGDALPPSQQAAFAQAVQAWDGTTDGAPLPLIQLAGPDAASKAALAGHVAARFGCELQRVCIDTLADRASDIDTLARLTQRERMLSPLALYFAWPDADNPVDLTVQGLLRRFFARSEGFFFIDAREPLTRLGRPCIVIDIERLTPSEQRSAWENALQDRARASHGALAAQFSLDHAEIGRIARQALQENADASDEQLAASLWSACGKSVRPSLNRLAQCLDACAGWDDLVLPPEQRALLGQISAQVAGRAQVYGDWGFASKMNRGLGISALFCGDSGTGKTMAAEVIANDLRLNLYRIDLSAVVSKYIGETEGNLRRLFDAAEDGGAILFFDECDALFGKRSEVKDSHDRYANMEINYLLQRIECYSGLAILATNMRSALDAAFVRRLRFIVNFPFPGNAQRRLIWEKAFPAGVPREPLDLDRLARINLAGGHIHNAALNAAFLAAQARGPVTMALVFSAIRTELNKLGRPLNEAELRVTQLREAGA